jgi:glutathione S-transferase
MEKGLDETIELVLTDPHVHDDALLAANPMHRVPTLILDDGSPLYDSPVICEWLDTQSGSPRLIPEAGPNRWAVLKAQALADGMMDDAVANVMESRRPEGRQSLELIAVRTEALLRCARTMEAEIPTIANPLSLAHIAAGCALAYLDFRLPGLGWRDGNPALSDWFEELAARPSMQSTRPDTG